MLPFYLLMVNFLKLKDSYLAVILPLMVSPWLIILMRNYMKSIGCKSFWLGNYATILPFCLIVSL